MVQDLVDARQTCKTPKRMLALDGGGVRGILSLGFLKHIESTLRKRYNDETFVLSQYFDFIGGTSTGAIIATLLALGSEVDEVNVLYRKLADDIFRKRFWRQGLLFTKFKDQALNKVLIEQLGDITFSDPSIQTGLMIMAKRWDTGSPWVLHNIRKAKYYQKYTRELLVRQIVRASTAAPSYFRPEYLEVKPGDKGAFVDGGVTPHNNPALQMLMLATLKGFGLDWPLGPEKLSLISIGTGSRIVKRNPKSWKNRLAMFNGLTSLQMMMDDAGSLNETLLQWMSNSPTAREIDKEIGDLGSDCLGGTAQFHYLRYNALLNPTWVGKIGMTITEKQARSLAEMDDAGNIELLARIGEKAGSDHVKETHFPKCFDVHERENL